MPAFDQVPETNAAKAPDAHSHRLMLLGLIVGMALAAALFAGIIRTSLHPLVLVVTSSLLVPALGGFVAGVIGRSLASSLGVVLLGIFGISNLANSPLWVVFLALFACCAVTVGSAALGILTARRSRWALVFPVVFLAVVGWQAGLVRADQERFADFRTRGIDRIVREVNSAVVEMPAHLPWRFHSDNDLKSPSFVAESALRGRRYRLWARRDDLRLRCFELHIGPHGLGELFIPPSGPDRARAARAYLMVLGFHPQVADALQPMEEGFYLQTSIARRTCRGQLDTSGAVSLAWGTLGRGH